MPDLLRLFQLTANLVQRKYLVSEYTFEADAVKPKAIESFGQRIPEKIDAPKRSNPRQYLYNEMTIAIENVYDELGLK